MNIKEYISQNGGYISSAEAKEKSLYNQLLYEVEKGTIVRVRQGIFKSGYCTDFLSAIIRTSLF